MADRVKYVLDESDLLADDEETDRGRAFWNDRRLSRLSRVKSDYDPGNVFRFNHNITPAPMRLQEVA
jgi:hypothetical protein